MKGSPYAHRTRVLKSMGYRTYAEYLDSTMWAAIRDMVLKRDKNRCYCCGKPAAQVHHMKYDHRSMHGLCLKKLVSICGTCHETAEFTKGKGKNDPSQANRSVENLRRKHRQARAQAIRTKVAFTPEQIEARLARIHQAWM